MLPLRERDLLPLRRRCFNARLNARATTLESYDDILVCSLCVQIYNHKKSRILRWFDELMRDVFFFSSWVWVRAPSPAKDWNGGDEVLRLHTMRDTRDPFFSAWTMVYKIHASSTHNPMDETNRLSGPARGYSGVASGRPRIDEMPRIAAQQRQHVVRGANGLSHFVGSAPLPQPNTGAEFQSHIDTISEDQRSRPPRNVILAHERTNIHALRSVPTRNPMPFGVFGGDGRA